MTPYLVTACENANINTLLVVGIIVGVLGCIPMLFIKETLNVTEDELLEEDEQ